MPLSIPVTLTENATAGLFCIQRYRFLTIDQFVRIACLHRSTAVGKLRLYEQQGFLGHFPPLSTSMRQPTTLGGIA